MSDTDTVEYHKPTGGWGSLEGVTRIFGSEASSPAAVETLFRQNEPKVFT